MATAKVWKGNFYVQPQLHECRMVQYTDHRHTTNEITVQNMVLMQWFVVKRIICTDVTSIFLFTMLFTSLLVCIYDPFNDTVSTRLYIAPNGRLIIDSEFERMREEALVTQTEALSRYWLGSGKKTRSKLSIMVDIWSRNLWTQTSNCTH
jgi:hypothetical protein